MADWVWSDWITPGLVPAKANFGSANAGAQVAINDSDDAAEAVDAVRGGGATGGSSLHPSGAPPYSYFSTGELDGDPFTGVSEAVAYDSSRVIHTSPPSSSAAMNVGYTFGYWRDRPDLRMLPPEFLELDPSEWVPIDPDDPSWAGSIEFEPGVDTVAVEWADVSVLIGAGEATINEVGGNVGYASSILLDPTPIDYGLFGSWPPPLGDELASWASDAPPSSLAPFTPPTGSDFTIVSYTDMAVSAYSPNEEWQMWTARPSGGPLGQPLFIWHQMPRYRYRIPAGAPRFYVKDLIGDMRPVGFGKPVAEAAVFRVPTPQGWFRDLTTAEYAMYGPDARPPGGYPLKVKRLDSAGDVWWDQVGWMVPDV